MVTHSFVLKLEPQPQCLTCQTICTVKHILIECKAFAVIRKWFFIVTSLTKLFENVKINDVLSFLLETELYEKIWRIKTGKSCTKKIEFLLRENFTYEYSFRNLWLNVFTYKQNLALNNLQRLIRHKTQTTNHPKIEITVNFSINLYHMIFYLFL